MENQDPSRTEEASGKRMGEERDKGNVMISQDVLSVVLLLIALPVTFLSTMPVTYDCFIAIINQIDQVDCRTEWTDSQIQHGGFLAFIVFCKAALPVMLATAIAAIVATLRAPALSTNRPPKAAARPRNNITSVNANPTCSPVHPCDAMNGFLNTLHA